MGAVTGQIAGAAWGIEAIPERWLSRLAWREKIEAFAAELGKLAETDAVESRSAV